MHSMGVSAARRLSLIAAACLAVAAIGRAADAQVVPGDTFTFDIAAFNSTSGVGYILGNDQSATFGTTQTYTAAGYNGQNITISSSEAVGATTTTDTFIVTTPTNFLTSTKIGGTTMTALEFDLGDANSGVTFAGVPNTVDYVTPVTAPVGSGFILYSSAGTSFPLTPTITQSNGGYSLASVEGVNDGATAISTLAVHEFEFAVTYANAAVSAAPEPSTWALMFAGVVGLGLALRRAKRRDGFAAFGPVAA